MPLARRRRRRLPPRQDLRRLRPIARNRGINLPRNVIAPPRRRRRRRVVSVPRRRRGRRSSPPIARRRGRIIAPARRRRRRRSEQGGPLEPAGNVVVDPRVPTNLWGPPIRGRPTPGWFPTRPVPVSSRPRVVVEAAPVIPPPAVAAAAAVIPPVNGPVGVVTNVPVPPAPSGSVVPSGTAGSSSGVSSSRLPVGLWLPPSGPSGAPQRAWASGDSGDIPVIRHYVDRAPEVLEIPVDPAKVMPPLRVPPSRPIVSDSEDDEYFDADDFPQARPADAGYSANFSSSVNKRSLLNSNTSTSSVVAPPFTNSIVIKIGDKVIYGPGNSGAAAETFTIPVPPASSTGIRSWLALIPWAGFTDYVRRAVLTAVFGSVVGLLVDWYVLGGVTGRAARWVIQYLFRSTDGNLPPIVDALHQQHPNIPVEPCAVPLNFTDPEDVGRWKAFMESMTILSRHVGDGAPTAGGTQTLPPNGTEGFMGMRRGTTGERLGALATAAAAGATAAAAAGYSPSQLFGALTQIIRNTLDPTQLVANVMNLAHALDPRHLANYVSRSGWLGPAAAATTATVGGIFNIRPSELLRPPIH